MSWLLPLLASLLLAPAGPQAASCGAAADPASVPLRSARGTTAVLSLHTEDDHGKMTHLCLSEYSLHLTAPDGVSTEADGVFQNDDRWGRPIAFDLQGFTPQDRAVVGLISEQGQPAMRAVLIYTLRTGNAEVMDLNRAFAHRLSAACQATLQVVGTMEDGIVLSSGTGRGCRSHQQWRLLVIQNATGQMLPTEAHKLGWAETYLPLDRGVADDR